MWIPSGFFFAEKVYDKSSSGVEFSLGKDYSLIWCGAGRGFETDRDIVGEGTGLMTENDFFSSESSGSSYGGREMELRGYVEQRVGLHETAVRAESEAHRRQPKL